MRRVVGFFVAFGAATSVFAGESRLSAEQVVSIVDDLRTETRTLGMLTFCEQEGLRLAVAKELMFNLVQRMGLEEDVPSQDESVSVFRIAEMYAMGVANGLRLSMMEESKKRQFCLLAGQAADRVLAGKKPDGGP